MKELFSQSIQVDETRSVSVSEIADKSIAITGVIINHENIAAPTGVRLIPEAAEALGLILNNWKKAKDNEVPFSKE